MGTNHRDDRSPIAIVQSIWDDRSHRRRIETLRALPPESMPIVFEALCDRAGRENGDAARPVVGLCDEWLAEAGCDDVREDWDEPHHRLIRAAARLAWRLADPNAPFDGVWDEPHVPLAFVRFGVRAARRVAQDLARPRLGLAVVSRLLEVVPRAYDHETEVPRADLARYEILGIALMCLAEIGRARQRDRGRAAIAEMEALAASLRRQPWTAEESFALELNAASLLHPAGDWDLADGDPRAASTAYRRALDRFEALEREAQAQTVGAEVAYHIRTGIANSLWRLSGSEVREWDLDKAFLHRHQAIDRYQALNPADPVIAGHLRELAKIAWLRTDFDAAAALLDEAAAFAREPPRMDPTPSERDDSTGLPRAPEGSDREGPADGDPVPFAFLLRHESERAMGLRKDGRYRDALAIYEGLAAAGLEGREPLGACLSLISGGDVCQVHLDAATQPDHLERARSFYEAALKVCHEAELGAALESDILMELGNVATKRSRPDEAIAAWRRCLSLRERLEPPDQEGIERCLLGLTDAYHEAGDDAAAAACAERSLGLTDDPEERLRRKKGLGQLLMRVDAQRAKDVLAEAADEIAAIEAAGAVPNKLRQSICGMLGTVRMWTNDFQGARDALTVAIEAAHERGDDRDEARWMSNLMQVQILLGDQDQVEANLGPAMEIHIREGDFSAAANLAMMAGHWYLEWGRTAGDRGRIIRAGILWAEAFALFHRAGDTGGFARAAMVMNRVHRLLGDPARADAYLREALGRIQAAGDERLEGYAHREWGDLHAEAGRWAEAEAAYARALELIARVGETTAEGETAVLQGRALERLGRAAEAERGYRRAVRIQNEARGGLRWTRDRMGIQGRPLDGHPPLIRLLAGRADRPGTRLEALSLAEEVRSRTLAELLRYRRIHVPRSLTPELRRREESLLDRLLRIEDSGESGPGPAAEHARLGGELDAVWAEIAAIDPACREYVSLRRTPGVEQEPLATMLTTETAPACDPPEKAGRDVVLVVYFIVENSLYVFGVRGDRPEPEVEELPLDRDELARFVRLYFRSGDDVRELAETPDHWRAYDRLVAPIAAWSAPGDIVCLVPHGPLHYLPLHALDVEGRCLIERNPVVYSPSASVLRYCQAKRRPGATTDVLGTAAVFGDPTGDLPGSRAEAEDVARMFGAAPLLGDAVTPESIRRALAGVDLVHFGGHSRFDADRPLESGLLLSGGRRLTAREVFALEGLDARLVALSSCESGVSENRPGDELIGLTRAFLYAGAPSIMVSLWRVEDRSSTQLMSRFYSELRGCAGLFKVDAMQRAALAIRREANWASFYHWAPFILVGDWR
jgi:tetratricopeptide (TPR) repeat protein